MLGNCSLNNDSNLIPQNSLKEKIKTKKEIKFTNKVTYVTEMTFEEFKIYIDDYAKKSNYPNID
nr:hypothetical protein [Candidatus Pelagibacter sp.]